ncbi:hypothetical protein RND71_032653 [Anisodus tanguticus]|uniref:Uncharacterized protein n=1 Tax=Anisodus tanguticus TaxID=243964 RepID=A0AAE1V2G2_9SOLA|nr:hypothetical protein RND71_032653 [Anisodus tanguticus]
MAERGNFGSNSMSQEDIEKLPCFDFQAKEKGISSPVDCAICLDNFKPSTAECILQLGKFSAAYNASDEGGNWGNFLHDKACEGPFRDYLYAMGIRANETGQLYLNSTQQTNCLTKLNDEENGIDVFSCGIEKLRKTSGRCSDFSVNNVNIKLGDKLRSLSYNCQFLDTADKIGHLCEFCVNS